MLSTVYIKAWFRENYTKKNRAWRIWEISIKQNSIWSNSAGWFIRKTNENSGGIILKKECIFCKRNLYKSKKLVKLTQCLELRAVQTIYNAAYAVNDFKILGLLNSNDIIAAEAHYHKDCYKKYVTKKVTCEVEQNLDAYKTVQLDLF